MPAVPAFIPLQDTRGIIGESSAPVGLHERKDVLVASWCLMEGHDSTDHVNWIASLCTVILTFLKVWSKVTTLPSASFCLTLSPIYPIPLY